MVALVIGSAAALSAWVWWAALNDPFTSEETARRLLLGRTQDEAARIIGRPADRYYTHDALKAKMSPQALERFGCPEGRCTDWLQVPVGIRLEFDGAGKAVVGSDDRGRSIVQRNSRRSAVNLALRRAVSQQDSRATGKLGRPRQIGMRGGVRGRARRSSADLVKTVDTLGVPAAAAKTRAPLAYFSLPPLPRAAVESTLEQICVFTAIISTYSAGERQGTSCRACAEALR